MGARFNSGQVGLHGTYTGKLLIDYELQVVTDGSAGGATFKVKMLNQDRTVVMEFQGGNSTVVIKREKLDGSGTYETHPTGVPLWVGDYIYEVNTGDGITNNSNKFVGVIGAITSGTEGENVKQFTITQTIGGTAGIHNPTMASGAKVTAPVQYVTQAKGPYNCTDHNDASERFTASYLHGLEIQWNSIFSGSNYPPMASAGSYTGFYFSAYPSANFDADKIVLLEKEGTSNLIGWNKREESFQFFKDIYNLNVANGQVQASQQFLPTTRAVKESPTMVSRGDDTYIGCGPNQPPMYLGYPNVKQFGQDQGSQLLITDGTVRVDTSALPSFDDFVLPHASAQDNEGLTPDLTNASQLIVGYVKGSAYLTKCTRSDGIQSAFYIGGEIMAIKLDPTNNNHLWVVYDNGSAYGVQYVDINASGTVMNLVSNRIYQVTGDSTTENFPTPFNRDKIEISDIVILDNFIYLLACDARYNDTNVSDKEKAFGIGDYKQSYLWRTESIANAPASIPTVGFTSIVAYDITSSFSTYANAEEGETLEVGNTFHGAFWMTRTDYEEWSDTGGTAGIVETTWRGDSTDEFKLIKKPARKGLTIWSRKSGTESVAVLINWVDNTFSNTDFYGVEPFKVYDEYEPSGSSNSSGSRMVYRKAGPFVNLEGSVGTTDFMTALGAHIEIYHDSEQSKTASDTAYSGVKRVLINNDSNSIDTFNYQTINVGNHTIDGLGWYGEGGNIPSVDSIRAFTNTTSAQQPRAVAIGDTNTVTYYPLASSADYSSSLKNKRVQLNSSVTRKVFTPEENLSGINLASQDFSHSGSNENFIAVTFSSSFVLKYLVNPTNTADTVDWSEVDILSTIRLSVANLTAGDDVNNKLPDADNDPSVNADYYKNFYKLSMLYDGYQESALGESIYLPTSGDNPNKEGHKVTVQVLSDKLPPRLSHINIYRAKAYSGNATEPDFDYNLVESVSLEGKGWKDSSDSGYVEYAVNDNKGKNFGSYESLTGISPAMSINYLAYGISTACAGYLFVSNANNPEIQNVKNYVFRSKAGKYSIFNWANEYVSFDTTPTALKSYNNMLYVFSASKIYTVNPTNLSIVNTMEGSGCLSEDSVIATDYGMFYADKYGVYVHNGRNAQVISTPIYSSDNTDLTNLTWDSISNSLTTSPPKLGFDSQRKALLVIFDYNNDSYAWVYSVQNKRWDLWNFTNPVKSITQGRYGELIASDGNIAQIATSGTRKPWEFQSKKITAGYDTYDKSFTEIHTEGSDSGLTTNYKTSGVSSWQSLSSNRISSSYKKAKWLQVKVSTTDGTKKLDSLGIHLRPIKARSSKV